VEVNNPLAGALLLVERGFKVFPCRPKGKEPAVTHWQHWAAESTPEKIRAYATQHPTSNWGVHAENLAIIDLDVKHGKDGKKEMALLAKDNPLVPTFVVETPSGSTSTTPCPRNLRSATPFRALRTGSTFGPRAATSWPRARGQRPGPTPSGPTSR